MKAVKQFPLRSALSTFHTNSSSSELFVLQYGRINEFHHRVAEQVRIMVIVKPKRHFIEVGRKMPGPNLMPRFHNPAF